MHGPQGATCFNLIRSSSQKWALFSCKARTRQTHFVHQTCGEASELTEAAKVTAQWAVWRGERVRPVRSPLGACGSPPPTAALPCHATLDRCRRVPPKSLKTDRVTCARRLEEARWYEAPVRFERPWKWPSGRGMWWSAFFRVSATCELLSISALLPLLWHSHPRCARYICQRTANHFRLRPSPKKRSFLPRAITDTTMHI
jgi:hypothetical protein